MTIDQFKAFIAKGNVIDIYADNIAVEQLGFNKRCAAARELIED